MIIFKSLQVSINFSTKFQIISLASGGLGSSPNPLLMHISKFYKFSVNLRVSFDKIFKNFKKSQNFL